MGKSGRVLLVALLALLVSPDVLGFSLNPAGARRAGNARATGRRSSGVSAVRMKSDARYDRSVGQGGVWTGFAVEGQRDYAVVLPELLMCRLPFCMRVMLFVAHVWESLPLAQRRLGCIDG